jgi:hypothetical protein
MMLEKLIENEGKLVWITGMTLVEVGSGALNLPIKGFGWVESILSFINFISNAIHHMEIHNSVFELTLTEHKSYYYVISYINS